VSGAFGYPYPHYSSGSCEYNSLTCYLYSRHPPIETCSPVVRVPETLSQYPPSPSPVVDEHTSLFVSPAPGRLSSFRTCSDQLCFRCKYVHSQSTVSVPIPKFTKSCRNGRIPKSLLSSISCTKLSTRRSVPSYRYLLILFTSRT
jgi:hypothetical protein